MASTCLRALAVGVLIVLGTAAAPSDALATLPGSNGRITFMRPDAEGTFQAWVADADMSHQRQVTAGPGWDAWFPGWSPDGRRIVFSSHHADPDPTDDVEISDIYTMRPDGSDVRKLTDSVGYSGGASWSPDGRWIVYTADRGRYPDRLGIYRIASDGSGRPHRLTKLPSTSLWQELPRFSPDGGWIVFDEDRTDPADASHDQLALFTMRSDGSLCASSPPGSLAARTRTGRPTVGASCSPVVRPRTATSRTSASSIPTAATCASSRRATASAAMATRSATRSPSTRRGRRTAR